MNNSPPAHLSAQLAVLNNRDLLDAIFEYFGGLKTELGPLRLDPLPAALTCELFLESALNALWRSLDSLIPLLKILPSFSDSGEVYALYGIVRWGEWARFDGYAQRVKYFFATDVPNVDERSISQAIYFRLSQLRNSPLLPALRHFYCTSVSSLGCGIFLFLSPSLQLVQLSGIPVQQDNLVEIFLSALSSEVSTLRSLRVSGELSRSSLNFVLKLENLRSLSLNDMTTYIDHDFLTRVLSHQHLEALDINLSRLGSTSLPRGFDKLKTLVISGGLPKIVAGFIGSMASESIETIIMTISQPSQPAHVTAQALTSLFRLLSQRYDTLRHVDVTYISIGRRADKLYDFSTIMSLATCERLVHLDMSNYALMKSLTDKNVQTLIANWPLIESLDLPSVYNYPQDDGIQNKPTIPSLYHLAESCPRLKHLRMPLYTGKRPLQFENQVFEHGLQSLDIDNSDVLDSVHMTRHLDHLFPKLESVRGVGGDFASGWQHVEDMVKMCQAIRLNENAKKGVHA